MKTLLHLRSPIVAGTLGWVLFAAMYGIVGALTFLGLKVETSFAFASPAGVAGFLLWLYACAKSVRALVARDRILVSIAALVISSVPLVFLGLTLWMSLNGGV